MDSRGPERGRLFSGHPRERVRALLPRGRAVPRLLAVAFGFGLAARAFSHAIRIAGPSTAAVAAESATRVQPWRPQAPLTGEKTAGWARTRSFCCSGFSLTITQAASGYRSEEHTS